MCIRDRLFRRSRVIGRRFKLVHVYAGRAVTEVATFRRSADSTISDYAHSVSKSGRIIRDNVYGSLEEDALRRDFTVNSIYYNPCSDELICHKQALKDIRKKRLCMIGNAAQRYREDPVRMLRALRFAAKLDLELENSLSKAIFTEGKLLHDVSGARLFDETVKLFHSGSALRSYHLLREYGLFDVLFPSTTKALNNKKKGDRYDQFLNQLFTNTDGRIADGMSVTPAFIIAGLWWLPTQQIAKSLRHKYPPTSAMLHAIREMVWEQRRTISILSLIHI